jgi:hypothetical protein
VTNDYGLSRKRRPNRLWVILGGVIAVAAAGYAAIDAAGDRLQVGDSEAKAAAYWTVKGPPCPGASKDEIAQAGIRLVKGFAFAGTTFQRGYGDVACREFHTQVKEAVGGDLVCQFTGPSALQVTTDRGEAYFLLGGRKATVAIRNGAARCVTDSHFVPGAPAP